MGPVMALILQTILPSEIAKAQTPPTYAIASAHPLATTAGKEILDAGGNAFDAAIAVAAALAVVEPYSSGLGGGGFWLVHTARSEHDSMIDARETAPSTAHAKLYLDRDGQPIPKRSVDGPLAAGIPGLPAGLAYLARHYARLPLSRTLAPAIRLARDGFAVSEDFRDAVSQRLEALRAGGDAAKIFLAAGSSPPLGQRIVQTDLGHTLEQMVARDAFGFYAGPVAADLVTGVRQAGGIWRLGDLASYQVKIRRPVIGRYHGMKIVSAAPPSAGGIVLIDALNILSGYRLPAEGSVTRVHLIAEALRRAYADRAQYLGDPDYVDVPVRYLISPAHARAQRHGLSMNRATKSRDLRTGPDLAQESGNTTHYSIIDAEGNRVAATLSINYLFGSGFVAPGTGVLLNDEMDDFASAPGVANLYGLVGSTANSIASDKRPLSSMTPTFLENRQRLAVLGTPGGSRISSMVLLGALEFFAGNTPKSWVQLPRFHHQYLPDRIEYESRALTEAQRQVLQSYGHGLQEVTRPYGNMQAIVRDKTTGHMTAASDPRGEGSAIVDQAPRSLRYRKRATGH
jgi:gamma-glutamyltranspeptidase / glutathione hydrolase